MPGYLDGAINQEEKNSVPINRKNRVENFALWFPKQPHCFDGSTKTKMKKLCIINVFF